MQNKETLCNVKNHGSRFTKVTDARKREIRGLWRRGERYYARMTIEDEQGRKQLKWIPLEADTPAQAGEELRKLTVERSENRLRHIGLTPKFTDYLQTYLNNLEHSGKKPDSIVNDRGHLRRWEKAIGHIRIDKIAPRHISQELHRLKSSGRSPRTCNLSLVALRGLLKAARVDGYLKVMPTEGIEWMKTSTKARRLFTHADIQKLIHAAPRATKNAGQFIDYLRFLQFTGAREKESLKVRWADVNFDQGFVIIGAQGDAKNRECRAVDFNPSLEAHLRDMHTRRAPDCTWLFPSPQRGEQDLPSRTFRESLLLVRTAAGMPDFGFHDLRHHFISYAVMAGIDFMSISKWVGHKDGGILIGKVYGHLADEHRQRQAQRLVFEPVIVKAQES